MKGSAFAVAVVAFGWALVTAADARHEAKPPEVSFRVVTVEVQADVVDEVETPFADALVDWARVGEETDCLWELLQREQVDLTFENVWAAGVWSDALGGACLMIGEDNG